MFVINSKIFCFVIYLWLNKKIPIRVPYKPNLFMQENILVTFDMNDSTTDSENYKKHSYFTARKRNRGDRIEVRTTLQNVQKRPETQERLNGLLKDTLTTGSLTDRGSSFLFLERVQLHWWTNEGKMEGKKGLFVLPGNGSGSGKKKKSGCLGGWLI